MHQRLVVREEGEFLSFQEEMEMTNRRISSQELPVGGRLFGLGSGELLGEEGQQGPGTTDLLLESSSQMGIGGIYSKRHRGIRFRVS